LLSYFVQYVNTPLYLAADKGFLDIVDVLDRKGASHKIDPPYKISIHQAAKEGRLSSIIYLSSNNTSINLRDGESKTPLHIASENNQGYIVAYLISKGAELDVRDDKIDIYSMAELHYFLLLKKKIVILLKYYAKEPILIKQTLKNSIIFWKNTSSYCC